MNKRQDLALKTHWAELVYLRENGLRTGPLEELALELEQCVAKLSAAGAAQGYHARERNLHVRRVESLRRLVRAQMLRIKRSAEKALKDLAGVEAARHVPHATAKTSTLVKHAVAMIMAVQPHKSEYINRRFPGNFLQKLRADVRSLVVSVKTVPREAKLLAEATAAAKELVREARGIERAMDGEIAVLAAEGNRRTLHWPNANRMGKVRGRRRKKRGGGEDNRRPAAE
jgi:hypothetical protein